MDKDVIPVRGQIVVVRNDPGAMVTVSGTDDGDDEVCYIMYVCLIITFPVFWVCFTENNKRLTMGFTL